MAAPENKETPGEAPPPRERAPGETGERLKGGESIRGEPTRALLTQRRAREEKRLIFHAPNITHTGEQINNYFSLYLHPKA